ncbi:MAG: hypothetical protein HOO67_03860 [Candidatus Peribacteraceae bacterium]|nr:hypothetical protein [Candidatus Peribacteraceae bacterium]
MSLHILVGQLEVLHQQLKLSGKINLTAEEFEMEARPHLPEVYRALLQGMLKIYRGRLASTMIQKLKIISTNTKKNFDTGDTAIG